jgi:hypothetical protein
MNIIFATLTLCALPFAWVSADTLTLGSTNASAGAVLQMPFNFTNTNQIVGMQFDLKFPASTVDVGTAVAASATTNHAAESREVTTGTRRIIVYSSSNQLLPSDLVLNVPVTLKTGSPQGGPTLNVSNVILTNKQGQTFVPTINRPALDAWRLANFTDAERADPNIIGDDKDPDGDGLSNLMEFLMGGNPKLKQDTYKIQAATGIDQADHHRYLTMLFRAGKNASAGTLTVQTSTDLINWNTSGIQLTPTGTEDAMSIEYEAAIQVDGVNKQFMRLVGARNAGQ